MSDKIIDKIVSNNNKYIIFYSKWCGYSMKALDLLRLKKVEYKGYNIDKINGGMSRLLEIFNNNSLLSFDNSHKTRPIIFFNGKFIGGYTDLEKIL